MAKVINPDWKADMRSLMMQCQPIDVTTSFKAAVQWLVVELSKRGVPYKLHNLGAGVTRLTTDTTTCPCCNKAL